ncbi:hypothetical protein GIB67_008389 [Kingdonia uniflora]|uniref:Uncharacterized protein n=1 Tax=Kingdonia uniflora TaxID=39325 RepID=A0A7J7N5H4_9MAGN|nr:hypothetical protein GIB67_008389 [Kingdonia uniflora]
MKKLQRNLNMSCSKCPHYGEPSYIFGSGGARGTADEMDMEFLGEVWNWFQNRRYATKSKLIKSPGKLSVSSLPRDGSIPMRNVPHFVPRPVLMPVPSLTGFCSLEDKLKVNLVRVKGHFSVTSENMDHAKVETTSERERLLLQKISELQTRMININDELTAEKLKHMRLHISNGVIDPVKAINPSLVYDIVEDDLWLFY